MSVIPKGYTLRNGRLIPDKKAGPDILSGLPTKYHNVRTEGPAPWGGTTIYDSRKEANYATELAQQTHEGSIRGWLIQPSFTIAADEKGRIRMRPDFLVIRNDGSIYLVDTKGVDTRESRMGRAVLLALGLRVIVL